MADEARFALHGLLIDHGVVTSCIGRFAARHQRMNRALRSAFPMSHKRRIARTPRHGRFVALRRRVFREPGIGCGHTSMHTGSFAALCQLVKLGVREFDVSREPDGGRKIFSQNDRPAGRWSPANGNGSLWRFRAASGHGSHRQPSHGGRADVDDANRFIAIRLGSAGDPCIGKS